MSHPRHSNKNDLLLSGKLYQIEERPTFESSSIGSFEFQKKIFIFENKSVQKMDWQVHNVHWQPISNSAI